MQSFGQLIAYLHGHSVLIKQQMMRCEQQTRCVRRSLHCADKISALINCKCESNLLLAVSIFAAICNRQIWSVTPTKMPH